MNDFLSGVIATSFTGCGVFFFFFWKSTGERLFFHFAVATWLFAFERIPLMLISPVHEFRPAVYLIRLAACCWILVGIVQKNLQSQTSMEGRA